MKKIPLSADIIQLPLVKLPKSSGGGINDSNATFPKPASLIQIKERMGSLSLQDQKVLNCLLFYGGDEISDDNAVHEAPFSEVRKFLGKHQSNDQVRASLKKLADIQVDYDILSTDGRKFGYGSFIQVAGHEVGGNGIFKYSFHIAVRPMLVEAAQWARLSMDTIKKFNGKYANRLYENLELYANRRAPKWIVSVEDFRSLMGAVDVYPGFGEFRRRVIEPALKEVNKKADFVADFDIEKQHGPKILEISFTVSKKSERKIREFNGKAAKKRAEGKIVLKPETYEEARAAAPGADVYAIESEWHHSRKVNKKPMPKNPDRTFVKFARSWYNNRKDTFL